MVTFYDATITNTWGPLQVTSEEIEPDSRWKVSPDKPKGKKVVYVAGPYRASSEYGVKLNIDLAGEAALFVWKSGGVALCPHKNTAFFGGAYGLPDSVWLEGDLELLSRCDGVYAMIDYESSQGAMQEIAFANAHDIPVFFQGDDDALLVEFLK